MVSNEELLRLAEIGNAAWAAHLRGLPGTTTDMHEVSRGCWVAAVRAVLGAREEKRDA